MDFYWGLPKAYSPYRRHEALWQTALHKDYISQDIVKVYLAYTLYEGIMTDSPRGGEVRSQVYLNFGKHPIAQAG